MPYVICAREGVLQMKYSITHSKLILPSAAFLACTLAIAGCHNTASHPDEKQSVTSSLKGSSQFSDISVAQDRDKGVMTLTGNVTSPDLKGQAEIMARQAAPDYTIANEIGIRPFGDESQAKSVSSSLDSAIEDNYKAYIKANKALNDQSINYSAKNGTLVLKGTVKTEQQKVEAEKLARNVPNVQQVVNEIEVNAQKHSTASS